MRLVTMLFILALGTGGVILHAARAESRAELADAAVAASCSDDSQCGDPQKPHCCCGLTGSGKTICRCEASCADR